MSPDRAPIYLDHHATTPADPRVVAAMAPWWNERFGNPHSQGHEAGREAEAAVERARAEVAALVGADPQEIVFTSGATEANNLAIRGAALFEARHRDRRRDHVVTVATEHKCVLASVEALARDGWRTTVLPVDRAGRVDLDRLESGLDDRTLLVSVMAANNEIGTLAPLADIGALCRARGILFHTDAAQAAGKVPLDVEAARIDLMSLSGHKMYGPKGIGALYVRRRPRARLEPLFVGGGQERGLRSGTLPTPLCVGFGAAASLAMAEMDGEARRLAALRDRLLERLAAAVPGLWVNGDREHRLPGNLNVGLPGIDALDLLAAAPGICASTGSACTSASVEPSYVLRALGLDELQARQSVRFGLGRITTAADIERAADTIIAAVGRVRASAPAGAA